jgi:peptidoglycan hydrolase-like protein with peptidoglycan-binding domain
VQTPQPPSINAAVLDGNRDIVTGTVLNATPTGSTDTAVLRWDNVVVPANSRITAATTAANGTILTLLDTGTYQVDMTLAMSGAVFIDPGIGLNMAASPIIADPVVGTDGVFKANSLTGVAALVMGIELSTTFYVDTAVTPATLRFLATDPFVGAPSGLVAGDANFRLVKLANVPF